MIMRTVLSVRLGECVEVNYCVSEGMVDKNIFFDIERKEHLIQV